MIDLAYLKSQAPQNGLWCVPSLISRVLQIDYSSSEALLRRDYPTRYRAKITGVRIGDAVHSMVAEGCQIGADVMLDGSLRQKVRDQIAARLPSGDPRRNQFWRLVPTLRRVLDHEDVAPGLYALSIGSAASAHAILCRKVGWGQALVWDNWFEAEPVGQKTWAKMYVRRMFQIHSAPLLGAWEP